MPAASASAAAARSGLERAAWLALPVEPPCAAELDDDGHFAFALARARLRPHPLRR